MSPNIGLYFSYNLSVFLTKLWKAFGALHLIFIPSECLTTYIHARREYASP